MKNVAFLVVMNLVALFGAAGSLKSKSVFWHNHEIYFVGLRFLPLMFLAPQGVETEITKLVKISLFSFFVTINYSFIISRKRSKRYRALKKATHYVDFLPSLGTPGGLIITFISVMLSIGMLDSLLSA